MGHILIFYIGGIASPETIEKASEIKFGHTAVDVICLTTCSIEAFAVVLSQAVLRIIFPAAVSTPSAP